MRNIKEKILEKATRLYNQRVETQHLYNESFNPSNLKFMKNTLLFDTIRNNDHLVKSRQHYPKQDLIDISLEVDLIIISKEEFDKIFEV